MKNKAAQSLGRLGGRAKSEAKAAASRTNGTKGGRPSLYAYVCQVWREDDGGWVSIGIPGNRESARQEADQQRRWLREADLDPRGQVRIRKLELGA
jgi:hypothetical protein